MKKKYLSVALALLLFATTINAQVGIGTTTPDASAILDVSSTNKGLLVPRIALKGTGDNTTIATPQISLLIYNMATAGSGSNAVVPGYYYWNGSDWEALTVTGSLSTSTWGLKGNSGTDPAADFIGTTDGQSLVFKINNQLAGKLNFLDQNTSWGFGSLAGNAGGMENTANGCMALFSNSFGLQNTAMGGYALHDNTTGEHNSATGLDALYSNTTGNDNTANGRLALYSNTTGSENTAIGGFALRDNTTGSHNTANGNGALYYNSSGIYNAAIGYAALYANTTGSNNTALGYGADVASGDLANATAIGSGAIVNASNKVRIGNTSVTIIEGQVLPTTPSDGRFKFNIRQDVHGLDFIMKLRPISYQFDTKKLEEQMTGKTVNGNGALEASYLEATALRHTGFIAQEVEKAAMETGYHFTGINKPVSAKDHYSLSYESFIMPLVKAVQEQQVQINKLEKEIEVLRKKQ